MALVSLEIPQRLMASPASIEKLSVFAKVPEDRMLVLVRAGCALGLLKSRKNRVSLTRRGAALVGVPGLVEMIRHHDVLYRDLSDPVAFFRGEAEPELANFWPYVFGKDIPQDAARTYSDLMAQSQVLVVEDTLQAVSLKGTSHLMDVGGGTGAFLEGVASKYPSLDFTLFDLPQVAPHAASRFETAGMTPRARIETGSFRNDPLPSGADMISLIRVLYDHSDETVEALIAKCFDALPRGGRLLISEPMLGAVRPSRPGDVYFALYTLAMGTGKTRSPAEIKTLCESAGFENVQIPKAARPFVTQAIIAQKL